MKVLKIAVILAILISLSYPYTATDVFVSLDRSYSDLGYGYAEFTIKNPTLTDTAITSAKSGSNGFNFNILGNNTATKSFNVYIWKNTSYSTPVYKTELVKQDCEIIIDNKTGEKKTIDCSYNQTTQSIETKWKMDWMPFGSETLKQDAKYRIRIEAKWDIPKASIKGYAVSRDWIPKINIAGTDYTQAKWDWWNASCNYRSRVNYSNSWNNEELVDFPFVVVLNSTKLDYAKTNATDIRFYDPAGNYIPKEVEYWNATGNSYVWIKDSINLSDDYFEMYYGCSNPATNDYTDVWDKNYYLGVWHMNADPTGFANITDSAYYGLNGSWSGGTWDDMNSMIGQGFNYSDRDSHQYINLGTTATLQLLENLTITALVKYESVNVPDSQHNILCRGDNGVSKKTYYLDAWEVNNNIRFNSPFATTTDSGVQTNSTTGYTFLGVRKENNGGAVNTFVNGVIATGTASSGDAGTFRAVIGERLDDWGGFEGIMDDIQIQNYTRSVKWINATYLSYNNRFLKIGSEEEGALAGDTNSQSYSATGFELKSYPFNITFTNPAYSYSNVSLVYNNSQITASAFNTTTFMANATAPFIMNTTRDISFHWSWLRNDSVANVSSNLTQKINYSLVFDTSVFSKNPVMEGENLNVYIQITNKTSGLISILQTYLKVSGSNILGVSDGYNGTLNYHANFNAPSITTPEENHSYNFTMVVYYGNQTRYQNITTSDLTIYALTLTNCLNSTGDGTDGNETALVYDTYDEDTWWDVNASDYSFTATLYSGAITKTFSFTANNSPNISICLFPNYANFKGNISLSYKSNYGNAYSQRSWFDFGVNLTNTTKYFKVYLLNSTRSYTSEFYTFSSNFLTAPNVWVVFQKWNYTSNSFQNLTSIFTGGIGKSLTYLVRYDVPYKVILYSITGAVLNTYQNFLVSTSPFNLLTTSGVYTSYSDLTAVSVDCSYLNTTKLLSCTYNDPNQKLNRISFSVKEGKLFGYDTICNETRENSWSGVFSCDLTSVSNSTTGFNYYVIGTIFGSNKTSILAEGNIFKTTSAIWGASGVIYALLLIVILFFVGIWKPIVAIILGAVGFIFSVWIGWINAGESVQQGAIIGLMIIIVLIIAWRTRQRSEYYGG